MSEPIIRVEGLGKRYRLGEREQYKALRDVISSAFAQPLRRWRRTAHVSTAAQRGPQHFWALNDVSFEVKQGEVLGIVGHNGAGKSTLLKILSRITRPTTGEATIIGRVASLLEVGTGFHPELTGRENIYLNGIILGMRKTEIDRKFEAIVEFAEVAAFLDTPVKRYSSGMYVRLAFAVAAHLDPEILIVDEVLAVGDAAFQRKCLGKMSDVASEGRTVLFVSHNMNAVQRLCPRSLMLSGGTLHTHGETTEVVRAYLATGAREAPPATWVETHSMSRRGSGQVRVEALRYTSGNPATSLQPYPWGPLEVELAVVAEDAKAIGSLAVILFDKNGTKLVNADTITLGRTINLPAGRSLIRIRIDELYLNAGTYVLGWWIANPLGGIHDFVSAGLDLEVAEVVSNSLGARPHNDGVVPCRFELLGVE